MRCTRRFAAVAAALCLCVAAAAASASVSGAAVYVNAQNGSDSNTGASASAPLKSLAAAQAAARTAAASGPVTVYMSGTFPVSSTSTWAFDAADSGAAAGQAVTYTGFPAATVSAGLHVTGFQKSATIAGAWDVKLPRDTAFFRQAWLADGTRLNVSRTDTLQYAAATKTGFTAKPGQMPSATPHNPNDTYVVLYESWTASLHQIASMNATTGVVKLRTTFNDEWATGAAGSRYFFAGFREALDSPGEFYFDRVTRMLSVIPPPGVAGDTMEVVLPQAVQLLQVFGANSSAPVHDLQFKNLTLEHAEVDVGTCFATACDGQSAAFLETAAVHVKYASRVAFDHVTIAHVGGYGWWADVGTHDVSLTYSHLFDLGGGGARLGNNGGQVPDDQVSTNLLLSDNVLHDGGHVYQMGAGVLCQTAQHTNITHNIIHDFLYTGVSIGWTWGYQETSVNNLLVQYNDIADIGQGVLSDMGCIYSLGLQPGTLVDSNLCRDVWSYNYGGWGMYTDQASRFLTYSRNVVVGTKCAGIHQHFGLSNHFDNVLLYDVNKGHEDGAVRSSRHAGTCSFPAKGPMGACSSATIENSVFVGVSKDLLYTTRPDAFRNFTLDHNDYFSLDNSSAPYVFPNGTTWSEWQKSGQDVHSVIADPEFANPAVLNFSVPAASPARKAGFVPIDLTPLGPRGPVGPQAATHPPAPVLPDALKAFCRV